MIHFGGNCHLTAGMIREAVEGIDHWIESNEEQAEKNRQDVLCKTTFCKDGGPR